MSDMTRANAIERINKQAEPTGDLISRQAVLDRKYVVEVQNMWHMTEEIEVVNVDDIKALPSVNPQEPKTGRWEWVQYDYNPKLGNWHCSECRSVVIECVYKNKKAGIPLYKYCPQCGAKMQEVEDNG